MAAMTKKQILKSTIFAALSSPLFFTAAAAWHGNDAHPQSDQAEDSHANHQMGEDNHGDHESGNHGDHHDSGDDGDDNDDHSDHSGHKDGHEPG